MRWLAFAALTAVLFGCANPANKAVNQYISDIRPRAESGIVHWSNYYQGLYEKVSESDYINKGSWLRQINTMIGHARALERGEIDQSQFEHYRRETQATFQAESDALRQQQRQARSAALLQWNLAQQQMRQQESQQAFQQQQQQLQQWSRTPTRTTCRPGFGQVECTTY